MAADVDDLGYKDVKIVVKSDQEASKVEVQGAIRRNRDAQKVPELSPSEILRAMGWRRDRCAAFGSR